MFVWREHKHLFSIRSCILFPSFLVNVHVCLHFSHYFIVPEFSSNSSLFQVTERWPDPCCQWHRHQQSDTRGGGEGESQNYSRSNRVKLQSIYPAQNLGLSPRDWNEKVSGTFETFLFDHIRASPDCFDWATEKCQNVETFRPYQQQRIPHYCLCGRKQHFYKFKSFYRRRK